MTGWTYSFHRFEDEADFLKACDAIDLARDKETGQPMPTPGIALDIVGTIWKGGTTDEKGEVIEPPVALDGFHVNAAWAGEVPEAWAASVITPKTPSRVWS